MKRYKKVRPLKADWHYKRGDIYLVNLKPYRGSEQGGVRPAVVVQNNSGNYHSPVLLVVPLTTKIKKESMPTHCLIKSHCLRELSMAICESPRPIDKTRIQGYLGKVTKADMDKISVCLKASFAWKS